ncbi:MAG: phytanoyl-CoA dioxygenase family protein, partial [Hyphomonadaceae bacterium]
MEEGAMTVRKEWRNPLPGAPDVESPFFDEVFAQKQGAPGWAEIARNLRRDGYAVIDFPAAKFDDLARRVRADLQDGFDLDHWARYVRQGASLRVQDAWTKSAAVREIAVNATVLRLLEFLYGRRAFPFQTLNFPVGTQQHFHSDSVHFSSTPERFMCGVWVALEDVGEENGPLIYYPGSHALPIYTTEHVA